MLSLLKPLVAKSRTDARADCEAFVKKLAWWEVSVAAEQRYQRTGDAANADMLKAIVWPATSQMESLLDERSSSEKDLQSVLCIRGDVALESYATATAAEEKERHAFRNLTTAFKILSIGVDRQRAAAALKTTWTPKGIDDVKKVEGACSPGGSK